MVIDLPVPPEGIYDDIPEGHIVALAMDEQSVLAEAATYAELEQKLVALGSPEFVMDKVLPKDSYLVL